MNKELDPRLPLIQDADLKDKIVLVRVDHNVLKKGKILDPYRIDASLGTLNHIVRQGGRLILMTHVGRPRDKKSGKIKVEDNTSVAPIAAYLENKLHIRFSIPQFPVDPEAGIREMDPSINELVQNLRARVIGGIYLPNTRWFEGEEAKDERRERLALQLADIADVFVNDAFGSWQPHASTVDVTKYLPSYAGLLMQNELIHLKQVLKPKRPFIAVVAGAKYDTKIGPLNQIYKNVDHLLLGGVIYNTFLCAKYDVRVAGVDEADIEAARELLHQDRKNRKIVELPFVIESDTLEERSEGKFRTRNTKNFKPGNTYAYLLDVAPQSFDETGVSKVINSAKTILVNAVMGFTPKFYEGSETLYRCIDQNKTALKLMGGGDTLQEFKNLNSDLYLAAINDPRYYFFTGGGTVLKAIEQNTPYNLEPVKALMDNAKMQPK